MEEVGRKIYTTSKTKKKFYVVIDSKGQMAFYNNYNEAKETFDFITTFGIPAKLFEIKVLEENS